MKLLFTGVAVALLTALPAWAQSPICGGISVVGDWVGGSEAESDLTGADTIFEADGRVPIAGHLVRMFTLSRETEIRIEVAAEPAGDPYIAVYDAAGTEVAADDDGGDGFASRVETTLATGTYCLAARSYESGVTDVSVRIGLASAFDDQTAPRPAGDVSPPPVTDGGAACFQSGMARLGDDLAPPDLTAGLAADLTAGETPALGFSLSAGTSISITAESDGGDPLIRLRDANGAVLGENDDFEGLDARIDLTQPLSAGEYCIEIEDLNGPDNAIAVALLTFDAAADRLRRLDAAEFAPTDDDDVPITDLGELDTAVLREVQASGRATWFTFDLPGGGLVLTEAIGGGFDPAVILFDRVGRRVGENDDGPEGLDSFLAARLVPGRYTLAVRLIDESAGPIRLLMERYVPAQ